ncbi:unnamed protein product [Caenorhabditis angaria]|uniref:Major facilitator superfamily (MFS) profile domain-containing protein n=1 Tax=Caenorhabditis angaria TaxID=860376 RepID=A0A9P1J2E7_9PELO|nr:unnamed protein product [Caenorhabditis angaria]
MLYGTLPIPISSVINSTLLRYDLVPDSLSSSIITAAMNGSGSIGGIIGIFFLLPLADTKGRKFVSVKIRSFCGVFGSVSFLLSALLGSAEFYCLAEIFLGSQITLRVITTAIYISECSPDQHRGFATFSLMLTDSLAGIVMYSIASPNILGTPERWFVFPLLTLIISIVCFLLTRNIPESPKWLVGQNRLEEASESIKYYHEIEDIDDVLDSMIREKHLTVSEKISIKQVWSDETMREAFKIVTCVYVFMMFTPSMAENLYSMQLHTDAGLSIDQTLQVTLILNIIFVPGLLFGTVFVDKIGRRRIVMIAGFVMIFKTWLMSGTVIISMIQPSLLTTILILICDVLNRIQLSTGLLSVGPLLLSEIFPPSARTVVAQNMAVLTLFTFVPFIVFFPIIRNFFLPAFYVPFMISQPLMLLYLYRHLPETKQRAVCDIIESLDYEVASRHATLIMDEKAPLLRKRPLLQPSPNRRRSLLKFTNRASSMDKTFVF